MKFTYTHTTKDCTDITEYTINKSNKITNKIRLVLDNNNIKINKYVRSIRTLEAV